MRGMPDSEARTKLCPMMSTTTRQGDYGSMFREVHCRGASCMLWRWDDNAEPGSQDYRPAQSRTEGHGRCGLSQ